MQKKSGQHAFSLPQFCLFFQIALLNFFIAYIIIQLRKVLATSAHLSLFWLSRSCFFSYPTSTRSWVCLSAKNLSWRMILHSIDLNIELVDAPCTHVLVYMLAPASVGNRSLDLTWLEDAWCPVNWQGRGFHLGCPMGSFADTLGLLSLSRLLQSSLETCHATCSCAGKTRLGERKRSRLTMPSRWSQRVTVGLLARIWGKRCRFEERKTLSHFWSSSWSQD